MVKYNCLIIDDDADLNYLTQEYFGRNELTSACATNIKAAYEKMNRAEFDCILLDINLGKESGYDVCSNIRSYSNVPIIFCSCRRQDEDILKALCMGGDDYVTKPFSLEILTAKIKAILRRHCISSTDKIFWKCFAIDKNAMSVTKNSLPINLSVTEFNLFACLVSRAGQVVDKNVLLSEVWGDGYYSPDTLNVYIRKLREKIESNPNAPQYIKTIWGVGYMLIN